MQSRVQGADSRFLRRVKSVVSNSNVASTPAELRRRNRRLATLIVVTLLTATLLCVLYIAFFGGLNKGPMEPFHSMIARVDAVVLS